MAFTNLASYFIKTNGLPKVEVSQYTSPDRQMSCASDMGNDPDVTLPWMLNPKWHASDRSDYASQSPDKAIKSIYQEFRCHQCEFFRPYSLDFRSGEPVLSEGYVEILQFKRQCSALMEDLLGIKPVPEEHQGRHSEVKAMISKAVQDLDHWVEEQRVLAVAEEEQFTKETEERVRLREQEAQSAGWSISRLWA